MRIDGLIELCAESHFRHAGCICSSDYGNCSCKATTQKKIQVLSLENCGEPRLDALTRIGGELVVTICIWSRDLVPFFGMSANTIAVLLPLHFASLTQRSCHY